MSVEPPSNGRGRLLKPGAAPVDPAFPAARLVKSQTRDLERTLSEAAATLDAARAQAERILAQAREDADAIRQQAWGEGVAEAAAQIEQVVNAAEHSAKTQMSQEIARGALAAAQSVLRAELSVNPDHLLTLIKSVLAKACQPPNQPRALVMSREDLSPKLHAMLEPQLSPRGIAIEASEQLSRGQVRVVTGQGGYYEDGVLTRLAQLNPAPAQPPGGRR